MNRNLMLLLNNINTIKAIVIAVIVVISAYAILRTYNIRKIRSTKGVKNNLDNIRKIKQRDRNIIKINKLLGIAGSIGKIPLFSYDTITREYMQYNLRRANVVGPGGHRVITPEEYKGSIVAGNICLQALILVSALVLPLNVVIITSMVTITLGTILPNTILRSVVAQKDNELKAGFPDLYLMLHYVLLSGGKTPIDRIMRSYARITDSQEILKFIDVSIDYIETYGEYGAMQHISKDYREVAMVGKMCRLVKQLMEGGDIKNELVGFRSELILSKKWEIERVTDKRIARAKRSFNILMIVLIQAIISAMLIYLPDISSAGKIFGG